MMRILIKIMHVGMIALSVNGLLQAQTSSTQSSDSAAVLYTQARNASMNQQWNQAYNLFKQIPEHFADSKYVDASAFWSAWCLSKGEHTKLDAFELYAQFIDLYPNSNYVDDARLRQIALAEELIQRGHKDCLAFLFQHFHSDQTNNFQQQATFALARLGYKETLPKLQDYTNDEALAPMARSLILTLEQNQSPASFHEFNLRLEEIPDDKNNYKIIYMIPTARLDLYRDGNLYKIEINEQLVIYNLQMHEVYRYMDSRTLKQNTQYLFDKTIEGSVSAHLDVGEYILAFIIENVKSKRKSVCLEQVRIVVNKN